MKKIVLILLFCSIAVSSQESRDVDYIRKHALLAVEEMELYKVPASITLSQGLLETGGGQSRLAEIALNHFGIKCKKEWTGPVISHTDDAPNECFRAYGSVQESYRDHSKFLAERPFYTALFKLHLHDYKGWAHGLKKAGYATNPKYANLLISRIEKYNLHQFDKLTPNEVKQKIIELYGPTDIIALTQYPEIEETTVVVASAVSEPEIPVKKIEIEERPQNPMMRILYNSNGINYIHVLEGESFSSIAKLYGFNAGELALYNELPKKAKLNPGQIVLLGKKKNKGAEEFYEVLPKDNMYSISQKTGVKSRRLYTLNRMKPGEQPKPGTLLHLRKKKK